MRVNNHTCALIPVLAAVSLLGSGTRGVVAADWPTYRATVGRSGASDLVLGDTLSLQWERRLAPPSPAWPGPARGSFWQSLDHIEPRVVDDRADHPVIVGNAVFVGSSGDDHVHCFDAATGEERWAAGTGGPVRYAPVVQDGRVFAGSDDGKVHCFDAETGVRLWARRVGPAGEDRIVGNGRVIAPLPVRTGLVAGSGSLYVTAGLFPTQRVVAARLDATDGRALWTRDLDHSPQGYLLLAGELLILPTGRSNPISLRTKDGASGPSFGGVGGTFAVVEEDRVVSGRGNDDTLVGSAASSGRQLVQVPGKHLAVTRTHSYLLGRGGLAAIDRAARAAASATDTGGGVVWTAACPDDDALGVASDQVLVGGEGRVRRFDAATGEELVSLPVDGRALGLAIAGGRLVVTTDRGRMYCFARQARTARAHRARIERRPDSRNPEARRLLTGLDHSRGYALLVDGDAGGDGTQALAEQLASESELRVVIAAASEERAAELRHSLLQAGLYGTRIAAQVASDERLPYADYLFNLVVACGDVHVGADELERVCTPGRGVVATDDDLRTRPPLAGAGSWTHQFADLGNSANSGDAHTTSRLELQWFGGPGPARMIDRHMRGPPPLAVGGRLFLVAENRLVAVDAYNGTELWERELPSSQRYAMPYDAGYIAASAVELFAAVDAELWRIDAATGEVTRKLGLPRGLRADHHVGYVGLDGDALIVSATRPTAHRTEPGRSLAESSYRSERPLVTARAVLTLDRATGRARWRRASGVIVQPTITVTPAAVCFVEARSESAREHASGRIELATLLEDAWLVALDRERGSVLWEQPLEFPEARNVLYLQHAGGRLILTGSRDTGDRDAAYHIRVLSASDGAELWRTDHGNLKPGELFHGEQVHHPVVLGEWLVAEPFVYSLATGDLVNPDGGQEQWRITRPGHSCGTMSGSAECLFFRAGNPTVLDLGRARDSTSRFRALSPSRVGCWINIIPADGLVLIPETSASCVCLYSLQTSMAFRPR